MPKRSSNSVRVFFPKFDAIELVRALREGITRLQAMLPIRQVVLFGSYAKGTYTVASDVDLLVIYQDPPRADAYALTKRVLNIPRLEPHLYTETESQAMAHKISRMIEGGIVLLSGPS